MGLDMYLYRKTYVQNWSYMKDADRHTITVKLGGVDRTDIKPERIAYIIEQVAYWRKANQIHNWFVRNVQDGVDNCQESRVDRDKLAQLVELCKRVLAGTEMVPGTLNVGKVYTSEGVQQLTEQGEVIAQDSLAAQLLPTAPGFFFGSTDYDEYYMGDLAETVDQLEPLLGDLGGEFYYHASW